MSQRWTLIPEVARPKRPSGRRDGRRAGSDGRSRGRGRRGEDRRHRTTTPSPGRAGRRHRRRHRRRPRGGGRADRGPDRPATPCRCRPGRNAVRPRPADDRAPRPTIEPPRPRRRRRPSGTAVCGVSSSAVHFADSRASRSPMSTIPPVRPSADRPQSRTAARVGPTDTSGRGSRLRRLSSDVVVNRVRRSAHAAIRRRTHRPPRWPRSAPSRRPG